MSSNACFKRIKEVLHFKPERCHPIRYFNYDELCNMGIRVSPSNDSVSLKNLAVIQYPNDPEIEPFWTTDLSLYPLSISAERSSAFFDTYEVSLSIMKSIFGDYRKEPVIPPLNICILSLGSCSDK